MKSREVDEGNVILVNAKRLPDDSVTETNERTGIWAWKRVNADGTADYRQLKGDIVFKDVDFGYDPGKTVLHDINLYGQVRARRSPFVGSTGAGKDHHHQPHQPLLRHRRRHHPL